MAYRFLIIDDEPVVREGISNAIDWEAHGFELVGACRDGREGLQAVEELRPDVVLTDICMPFVDGLELAAAIGEEYPAVRTLLLTGHDEFEYAQAAIKLKVQDFLLKPITAEELRGVLDALRIELDEERASRNRLDRLVEQVQASLPVYRERFLNRLVQDSLPEGERTRALELLDLHLPGPAFIALVVDPDAPPNSETGAESAEFDGRLVALAVHDLVHRAVEGIPDSVSFSTPREESVVLLSLPDTADATATALSVAETISDAVERELGRTVSIGIGEGLSGPAAIVRSFRGARGAMDHRFVLGPGQIITIQQVRGGTPEVGRVGEAASRARFLEALTAGSGKDASAALADLVIALRSDNEDISGAVVFMHRLLSDTLHSIEALGVDYREVPAFDGNPFARLAGMKTLGEMERWFSRVVDETLELLGSRRVQHSQRKAMAAVEYIDSHYADPDLSLQKVCSVLGVSKSHLSPIFKAHTGMTFVEYVTCRRAEEAKILLASDRYKIYEIAERVGFRDAHYFSMTFKKQTGVTPREFQDSAVVGRR